MNDEFFWLIPVVAIIGGITSAVVATITRGRIRELEIRERIAMIERGLMPPPESDPQGFDRAMAHVDRHGYRRHRMPGRHRRAGITLIGVGFGLIVLIGFTSGEPAVAFGVGGFLVILGIAFFINGLFERFDRVDVPIPTATRYAPPPASPASSAAPTPAPPDGRLG
jgi:hypothetical protein